MESQSSTNSGHNVMLGDDKKILVEDGIVQATLTGEEHISASTALDPAAERRLLWKFDLRILPTLAVMYFFNALVSLPLDFPLGDWPPCPNYTKTYLPLIYFRTREISAMQRPRAWRKTSSSRTDSTISSCPSSSSPMS